MTRTDFDVSKMKHDSQVWSISPIGDHKSSIACSMKKFLHSLHEKNASKGTCTANIHNVVDLIKITLNIFSSV